MTQKEALGMFFCKRDDINDTEQGCTNGRRVIRAIYEDLRSRKCANCKYCDEVRETLIHCEKFEQFMPIEIGKCDMWEQR